jgi:hypothetical protein
MAGDAALTAPLAEIIEFKERSESMKIAAYNQHRQARFFQAAVVYATKSTRD